MDSSITVRMRLQCTCLLQIYLALITEEFYCSCNSNNEMEVGMLDNLSWCAVYA